MAKLSTGDLVALEAKYHAPCLALLYKKEATVAEEEEKEDVENLRRPEGIALAELVSYIEESHMSSAAELPVFKLAELADKYTVRLTQLGEDTEGRIHTARLKDTSKDVMFFLLSRVILLTHCRKLIRRIVTKKRCTLPRPQALCAKTCLQRSVHLRVPLDLIAK